MNREPVAIIGAVTAAATAILALVVAFGLDVSPDQQAAILGVVAVLAPLTATLVTRSWVYAPATVERLTPGDPGL